MFTIKSTEKDERGKVRVQHPAECNQTLSKAPVHLHVLQFDIKGRNFLHVAVQKADLEAVLFLLSVCVNVNSRVHDSSQMTPLHLAVISGNEMIVRNLVCTLYTVGRTRK